MHGCGGGVGCIGLLLAQYQRLGLFHDHKPNGAQGQSKSIKIQETTQNSIMNIWIVAHQIHQTWRFFQRSFGQCYLLFLSCIHPKVQSGQPAARQGAALPPLDLPLGPENKESSRMFLKICKFCLAVIWGWALLDRDHRIHRGL